MSSFLAFSPFARTVPRLLACALLGPIIALGSLSSLIGQDRSIVGIVVVAVIAGLALVPLVPQRVTVGTSSLGISWLGRAREIPYDSLASFESSAEGFAPLAFATRDGARGTLLVVGGMAQLNRVQQLCAPIHAQLAARTGETYRS